MVFANEEERKTAQEESLSHKCGRMGNQEKFRKRSEESCPIGFPEKMKARPTDVVEWALNRNSEKISRHANCNFEAR